MASNGVLPLGLNLDVRSVASVFLSRWDGATMDKVPDQLRDKLGIAIGQQIYKAYRDILESDRWQRLANFGARPARDSCLRVPAPKIQRLPMFFTSARLAAPNTVDTIPEKTLLAFGDHGKLAGTLPRDGGDCETVLDGFRKGRNRIKQLAADLQTKGAKSFDESWQNLLSAIESKGKQLQTVS